MLPSDPRRDILRSLIKRWSTMPKPGDPFNTVLDQIEDFADANPDLFLADNPVEITREYLRMIAERIKEMLADRLGNPDLKNENMPAVSVVDEWQINSNVLTSPPYDVHVSLNLWRFCAGMSELFIGGVTIDVTEGEDGETIGSVASPIAVSEVSRHVKQVLPSFLVKRTIPLIRQGFGAAHLVLHQIIFFSAVAFVIGHELGHVVISESMKTGAPAAFEEYAKNMLSSFFHQIRTDVRHDPASRVGLSKLRAWEGQVIYAR